MMQVQMAKHKRTESFGFLIQVLARRIDTTMKEELLKVGVDVKIFVNLMLLSEQDGINQRQLGEKLDFPEYYTSRNVDSLVKAGFVERRQDPNSRRTFLIYLTDKGREKAKLLPPIVKKVNDQYLKELTSDERKQLISLLQKSTGH
ncbi:MAG: MarR family transcriptional regulator [Cohaesibacter sp.]|nr:MarR family transcriptional regulator [Cohaesibacter sp.]